jgi:hypothetical protein
MSSIRHIRLLLMVVAILGCGFWTLPSPASACEICEYVFLLGYAPCKPVGPDDVGSTICTDHYDPISGFSCQESGDYCSNITIGGGGGTGGGSDGGSCQTAGFCPAQCFSCGGGGGRPAV